MNSKIIALTFRGLRRRFKNILRSMVLVVLAFTFVTGVLLLQENMSNWQKADNKKHFGDWFVMYRSKQPEENESIKKHPYTGNVYTAKTVTSVKDRTNLSDIMIGTMSDGFISMGSIALEKGKMPDNDNEAAIDRNSLIRLGHDHYLTIRAERHCESGEKNQQGNYLRCERSYGSYARSFDISGVKEEDISAEYKDGVLRLKMPKEAKQKPEPRRLTIS